MTKDSPACLLYTSDNALLLVGNLPFCFLGKPEQLLCPALQQQDVYKRQLLGLIASAILFVPLFTNLAARGMERLYGAVFGNEGRLAARNMRDNRNTTQNITLLFISISAVIAIQVVGDFVTAYVSDVFNGAELQGFAAVSYTHLDVYKRQTNSSQISINDTVRHIVIVEVKTGLSTQ